jgi:hypothetical protein
MNFDKNIKPPIDADYIAERRKFIDLVLSEMKVTESKEFQTDNIKGWRSSFDKAKEKHNRNQIIEKKFTIKHQKDNTHRIWRIL